MSITIYGSPMSPFVRKVRVFMIEKQIDYQLESVNVFDPPAWFLPLSPLKRIPVLRHEVDGESRTLPDTSVICAYLEKVFPAPNLYPIEPGEFGRALWFEEYSDTEIAVKIGFGILRSIMAIPRDDKKIQETLENKLPKVFDYLTRELKDSEFLVGKHFSIADIAVATHFMAIRYADLKIDQSRWPKLREYIDRIHDRPSFKICFDLEKQALST